MDSIITEPGEVLAIEDGSVEEEEDADEDLYFAIELMGKDAVVITRDEDRFKLGDVYWLKKNEEGDMEPSAKAGKWVNTVTGLPHGTMEGGKFVPLKSTLVVKKKA